MWKLTKALYGLKSAPKAWTQHLAKVLEQLGYIKSVLDESVFSERNDNKNANISIPSM